MSGDALQRILDRVVGGKPGDVTQAIRTLHYRLEAAEQRLEALTDALTAPAAETVTPPAPVATAEEANPAEPEPVEADPAVDVKPPRKATKRAPRKAPA